MKKPITLLLICLLALSSAIAQQQRSCAVVDELERQKQQDLNLELRL